MTSVKNLDVSELIFTDITYDVNEEDLDHQTEFSTVEELHDSLPKIVRVSVPHEEESLVRSAIKRNEISSLGEIWDWFSEETGWCVCAATVSSKDGQYSE